MTATAEQSGEQNTDSWWGAFQARVEAARHKYDCIDPSTCLYALVDTRGQPDLRAALERLASIPFASLWDGTDLALLRDIAPLLIKVDLGAADAELTCHLLKRLWRFYDGGFMVTWIWSPHGLDELAGHFRVYCEYALPDRRAFYLHFYDNRILETIRLTWTDEEWTLFASVAFEVWYRKRSGEECLWGANTLSQRGRDTPLELTDEQHLKLLSRGYADKVATQLREIYGSHVDHLSSGALYEAVQTQVARARGYGIREEQDMLRYVAKGLLISPRFDEHPLIGKRLKFGSSGTIPFAEVLSRVDQTLDEDDTDRGLN